MHGRSNTVFLNHAPGGVSDIAAQIRSGFMEANASGMGQAAGAIKRD